MNQYDGYEFNLFECTKCGEIKEKNLFRIRKDRPKGISSWCKSCMSARETNYYKNNPSKMDAKKAKHSKWLSDPNNYEKAANRWRRRDFNAKEWLYSIILEYKNKPCVDCKKSYPPWIMDFDHLDPTNKIANISKLSKWRGNKEKLLQEINKCELVCSNCHRQRTHDRHQLKIKKI